jgi:hypothetical protein
MSSAEPLPPISPHWRTLVDAIRHCRQRVGNNEIAHAQLAAAINRGDVGCKIEQLVRRPYPHPSENISVVPPPDFFQRDMEAIAIPDGINLRARHDFRRHTFLGLAYELVEPYTVYVWGPNLERLWPAASTTTINSVPVSSPGSPDAWIDELFPGDAWRLHKPKRIHDRIVKEVAKHNKDAKKRDPDALEMVAPSLTAIRVAVKNRLQP